MDFELGGSTWSQWIAGAPDLRRWLAAKPQDPVDSLSLEQLAGPLHTYNQLQILAAQPRQEHETFQFAVLGDVEPGRFWFSRKLFNRPGIFERQLQAIQTQKIDFSIQLGDMVSRGIERNYLRFFRALARAKLRKPYLTVIGNHDRVNPHGHSSAKLYTSCFGKTNYYFDRGCVRYVVVDTSNHYLTAHQLKWLDLVLQTPLKKLVFTHIPPGNLKCTDFIGRRGLGGFSVGAVEFTKLMSRHHVERVYMGHVHGFCVQDFHGVRYILSGGGGSPLFPSGVEDRFYHYIMVEAGPHGIRDTVHSLDGRHFAIPNGKVVFA